MRRLVTVLVSVGLSASAVAQEAVFKTFDGMLSGGGTAASGDDAAAGAERLGTASAGSGIEAAIGGATSLPALRARLKAARNPESSVASPSSAGVAVSPARRTLREESQPTPAHL